jgi:hypothetical protein
MPKHWNDPTRTLQPIPDGAPVQMRIVLSTLFTHAPFGPLATSECTMTVQTSLPTAGPENEHHWKHVASLRAWESLAGFQPAGEHMAEAARALIVPTETLVCCLSPIGLRLF